MPKKRQGFMIFHTDIQSMRKLMTNDQIAKLLFAIDEYNETGEVPQDLEPAVMGAMAFWIPKIDEQQANYERTCERNRSNGAKSHPLAPTRIEAPPVAPSRTQSVRNEVKTPTRTQLELEKELELESEHDTILTDSVNGGFAADAHAQGADAPKPVKEPVSKEEPMGKEETAPKPQRRKKQTDAALIARAVKDYAACYGNEETESLLNDWLAVRKARRSPATIRAVQLNLDKLDDMALASGLSINEYLRDVIARGWAAFYVIREHGASAPPRNRSSGTMYGRSVDEMGYNDPANQEMSLNLDFLDANGDSGNE